MQKVLWNKAPIRALVFKMTKVAKMILGCLVTIKQDDLPINAPACSCLDYTKKPVSATIWIDMNNDYFGNQDFETNAKIYWGLFAHEMLHLLMTDFDYWNQMISGYPSDEKKARHAIMNIIEDPAIESFSSGYLPDFLVKCLRFTIAELAKNSKRIDEGQSAYEEVIIAMTQFGDTGILYGDFTDHSARDCFTQIAPIMDRAIQEIDFKKRYAYAMEIFDLLQDLFEKSRDYYEDQNIEQEQVLDDLLESLVKSAFPFGSGSILLSPLEGPIQNENQNRRQITIESIKKMSLQDAGGAVQQSGSNESNFQDEEVPSISSSTIIKAAPVSESDTDRPDAEKACCSDKEDSDSSIQSNCGKNAEKEHINERNLVLQKMQEDPEDSLTGFLSKLSSDAESELKILNRKDASDSDLTDLSIKSPYIQKDIEYRIVKMPEGDPVIYSDLYQEVRKTINGLIAQLRVIFQSDMDEKYYHSCGRVSIRRLASSKVTTRLFEKEKMSGRKKDIACMILIDMSGSMAENQKLYLAQKACIVLTETFAVFGMRVKVLGFETNSLPIIHQFGGWNNTKKDRQMLTTMTARGGTFLGFSLRYAGEILKNVTASHRVFFVITDGEPCDHHYRDQSDAFRDVADAIHKIKQFSDFVGIGLFEDGGKTGKIYDDLFSKEFFSLSQFHDLPRLVSKKMRNIVRCW